MATLTFEEIAQAILEGVADGDREARLFDVVKQRRKIVAATRLLALQPGDRVRFTQSAKPAYIRGATATVEKVKQTRVDVLLDEAVGSYSAEASISCPASIIEKVAA